MVVGTLVMGATFAVMSLSAPPPSTSNPASEQTENKLYSGLSSFDDIYIDNESYSNSALSRAVAESMAGNEGELVESIESLLPPTADFCAYLDNGVDRHTLHCPTEPTGPTLGVSYPFEPGWQQHFGQTDLGTYREGASTTMGVSLAPMLYSQSARDPGIYIEAEITGEQNWLPGLTPDTRPADFTERAATTLIQGDNSTDYPSASIHMQCARDDDGDGTNQSVPCYAMALEGVGEDEPFNDGYGPVATASAGAAASDTSNIGGETPLNTSASANVASGARIDMVVENAGPGEVPQGTTFTASFPVGLHVYPNGTDDPGGDFKNVKVLNSQPQPQTVKAKLDKAIPEDGRAELEVWVSVTDQRYAYKTVNAQLQGGAVSSSQFLLLAKDKANHTYTGGDTRVPLVSGPKPSGSMNGTDKPEGRWAVVLPIPYSATKPGDLNLSIENGKQILSGVDWPGDFDPTFPDKTVKEGNLSVENDNRIHWEAPDSFVAPGYTFVEWQFNITTDGTQTKASPGFPMRQPEVQFNNYETHGQFVQTKPGLWWQEYPPDTPTQCGDLDCPGYENDYGMLGPSNSTSARDTHLNVRNSNLNGTIEYELASITNPGSITQSEVKDAIDATRVTTEQQTVNPGDTVTVNIHANDLQTFLSRTVGASTMEMQSDVYAPWGVLNMTPAKTIDHEAVSGTLKAPTDLLPGFVNEDASQDVLVASEDGNVYSLSGNTGVTLADHSFDLPGRTEVTPANPTVLERARDGSGNEIIPVGTTAGTDKFHTIDGELKERWWGHKPDGAKDTLAINISRDVSGDGVPDMIVSTEANAVSTTDAYAKNKSQLVIYNGDDLDNDGQGEPVPGWGWSVEARENESANESFETPRVSGAKIQGSFGTEAGFTVGSKVRDGIVTPGIAENVGMGKIGVHATEGVYADTGREVSTNAIGLITKDATNLLDEGVNTDGDYPSETITVSEAGAGLIGFTRGGQDAFNLTGVDVRDTVTAEEITEGDKWSGTAVGGGDGWVFGLNASQPIFPVTGWTDPSGSQPLTDVAMANELEGYKVAPDGTMLATENGWTTFSDYGDIGSLRAVDTPDGPPDGSAANTSWWVGDLGSIVHSDGGLESASTETTTAALAGVLDINGSISGIENTLENLDDYNTTEINFTAVEAVSETEAWFVGYGIPSSEEAGDGFIGHTVDGAKSYNIYRVDCGDTNCAINGIDRTENHTWVAGNNGLVLIRDSNSSAASTTIDGTVDVDQQGRLAIPLSTDDTAQVKNVEVTWDPATKFTAMKASTLDDDGTDRDLWNKTKGCADYIDGTIVDCSESYGAQHGNTLLAESYVLDSNEGGNRTLDGSGTLTVGPFTDVALDTVLNPDDPYKSQSWWDKAKVTVHTNVTYADGSKDTYTVDIDDGTIKARDASMDWVRPGNYSETNFTTPDCFGDPDGSCADFTSINVTNVGNQSSPEYAGLVTGEPGSSNTTIHRMLAGTNTWEAVDTGTLDVLRDGTINPKNPDTWVAVGGEDQISGGTVYTSHDAGENWTLMPVNPVVNVRQPHFAVDATHGQITHVVGGGDDGYLSNAMGGHSAYGAEATVDIYDESNHSDQGLAKITMTSPPDVSGAQSGTTPVEIDVWDEDYDKGEGAWVKLYDPDASEHTYEFNGSAKDVKLRFEMASNGSRRYSATISGSMSLAGVHASSTSWDNPPVTIDFALSNAESQNKFEDEIDELDYSASQQSLRLPAFQNPWLHRLGNSEEGPWSDVGSGTVGARPTDIALSPDEETLWVATGGIYDHSATALAGPLTDNQCSGLGSSSECYDNSLYAVNLTTGAVESWWDPIRFDGIPTHVAPSEDYVYLTAEDDTKATVTRIPIDDPPSRVAEGIETSLTTGPVLADAFVGNAETGDVFLSGKDTFSGDGRVHALKSPTLETEWEKNPALKGVFQFDYDVPKNAPWGTHVIATNITWDVSTVDSSLVQSSKVHSLFTVTPEDRRQPLKPTYNLEIVAWMQGRG